MSLTRAELLAAVTGEQTQVLELVGLTALDNAANMKSPIDKTFRALGSTQAGLGSYVVPDGDEDKAVAFANYFVLDRALSAIASAMNVAAGSARAELHQQWENIKELTNRALIIAQGYGLTIAGGLVGGFNPIPYVGGIDDTDWDIVQSDRKAPLFSIDDLNTPSRAVTLFGDFE